MSLGIRNYWSRGRAFRCDLLLDGKRAALVTFDGHGDRFRYDWQSPLLRRQFHRIVDRAEPARVTLWDQPVEVKHTDDSFVAAMLEKCEVRT